MSIRNLTMRACRGGLASLLLGAGAGCAGVVPDATPPEWTVVESGQEQGLYGPQGRERQLFDLDHDGRADVIVHYRDGHPVLAEVDADRDGIIERWEYLDSRGRVERVASSRRNSGRPDEWTWPDAEGRLLRRELDQDGDGRPDRFETYLDGRLVSVR